MPAIKEQIRQIIVDNNLNSMTNVYSLLKESFKDILQELIETAEKEAAEADKQLKNIRQYLGIEKENQERKKPDRKQEMSL